MKTSWILFLLIAAFTVVPAQAKVVGTVGMVEGQVLVDNTPVKKTASVRVGSVVEVRRGKATLIVGKGNVFHLSSDTKMVVSEFGAAPAADGGTTEKASLDLKFGRTRALIMNSGNDKKDLKIRARAATMGVRGTEIFIDAPRDSSKPVNFFTLEGRADVQATDRAMPVAVNQNQGVSTSAGSAGSTAGGTGGSGATGGGEAAAASAPAQVAPPTLSLVEVQEGIRNEGMQSSQISTPQDLRRQVTQQYLSDQFGMGALPPLVLDPMQDRFIPIKLTPRFCDATTGSCP